MTTNVESICAVQATLGEGPVWAYNALWFTDIKQCRVYRLDPTTSALRRWDAPSQIGWVLPAHDGAFVAGLQTGLHRFDPEDGSFSLLTTVEADRPGNRLNDACTDPSGRIWFGSMDDTEAAPSGAIYRADSRGIARVIDGISITNGPAVSPDGATLYHHDTLGGLIYASDINEDGEVSNTRILITLDNASGYPDGPVVDSEGFLWVGLYCGWAVHRYAPSGELVQIVRLPVANVTKIAFGGPELRTAFATTASKGLSAEEKAAQPLAGNVFTFDPGVRGQPTTAAQPFGTTLI